MRKYNGKPNLDIREGFTEENNILNDTMITRICLLCCLLFKKMFIDFSDRGRERETSTGCLPGIKLATQVCTLTRNQTPNLLVYGMTLQQVEPHQPGLFAFNVNEA